MPLQVAEVELVLGVVQLKQQADVLLQLFYEWGSIFLYLWLGDVLATKLVNKVILQLINDDGCLLHDGIEGDDVRVLL